MSKTTKPSNGTKSTGNVGRPKGTTVKKLYNAIIFMLYSIANNGKLSGRADGNVYMRNGRVRSMKVPRLVRNTYTQSARGLFANFSSAWRSLSADDQLTWLNYETFRYDRFANAINVRGNQAFIATNVNLSNIGEATLTRAPKPDSSEAVQLVSLSATTSSLDLYFIPVLIGTSLIYATTGLSAGINRPSQSAFRLIGIADLTTASPADIFSIYTAKFGNPIVGTKIFLQVINVGTTSGQASAITAVNTLTT